MFQGHCRGVATPRPCEEKTMLDSNRSALAEVGRVEPTATLELLGIGDVLGTAWPTITSAIKARLQQLQPGQVLSVKLDDPLARLDVPAWCALTGNVLQATSLEDDGI